LVPYGDGSAQTQAQRRHHGGGEGHRSAGGRKKGHIEQAYAVAALRRLPLFCQDEAGPYQAVPQKGASWQPEGEPARQAHEYVRGGTAKLLTLFQPATGEVRAKAVTETTNAVVHPWLKAELAAVLAGLPPVSEAEDPLRQWETWGWDAVVQEQWGVTEPLPPIRLLLVWDNLSGHKNQELVQWLVTRGVLPLYTPIGGSWLNMAESVQRILVRRALDGQHPESAAEVMAWLEAAVAGWNRDPTPFEWGGKRKARRQRARERRHRQGGSEAYTRRRVPRRMGLDIALANRKNQDK
jgi:hypothetical protein